MNFSSYYDWVLVISIESQLDGSGRGIILAMRSSCCSSPHIQVAWHLEIHSPALLRSCTFQVVLWEEPTWKPTEQCRSWGGRATAALVLRGANLWGGRWGEWEIEAPGQQMNSQKNYRILPNCHTQGTRENSTRNSMFSIKPVIRIKYSCFPPCG